MAVFHSRSDAVRAMETMPEKSFEDGVLIDVPKRRRREEAQGKREFRPKLAKDQQRRMVIQFERYVSELTKDMGIELMLRLLEAPDTEMLKGLFEKFCSNPSVPRANLGAQA